MKNKKPDLEGFWAAVWILTFVIGGFIAVYWIGRLAVEIPAIGGYLYVGNKINNYFLSGFIALVLLAMILGAGLIIYEFIKHFIYKLKAKRGR